MAKLCLSVSTFGACDVTGRTAVDRRMAVKISLSGGGKNDHSSFLFNVVGCINTNSNGYNNHSPTL